jgi:predicted membrane protein
MTAELPSVPPSQRPRLTSQVLVGLMVIAVGVLFTLDNLDLIDAREYLRYWPVGLIAVGALKLWHASRGGHGWFGGVFLLVVGAWMLINHLIYITIDGRTLLPLFLLCLGSYLVWRGFGGTRRDPRGAVDSNAHLSALAIMGGIARRTNSAAFQGADLTAIMGGCEIDLRQASIAPNTEAVIDVFAFWGGIDIKVPDDWTVITRAVPLMGGVEDKTHAPHPASAKRVVIRGLVVMGGVVVKNSSDREEDRQH